MWYGVDSFSLFSWELQEKGMMNIAAMFSLSLETKVYRSEGEEAKRLKVMLASLR
jgi:hypothetical protein